MGTNAVELGEPMLCYLAFARRTDSVRPVRLQPLEHPAMLREVTRVTLAGPWPASPSEALQSLMRTELVGWHASDASLVELGFDGERGGNVQDFRPALPLVLNW